MTRSHLGLAAVAAATLAFVGGQLAAGAGVAGGRMVFSSSRDGLSDIFAVNVDGTGLTKLTSGEEHEYAPVPSPGGAWVAYQDDAHHRVMLIDARGKLRRRLPCTSAASWSPDGRLLACAVTNGRESSIGVVNVRSGKLRRLAPDGVSPAWSPDGRRVAFIGEDGNGVFIVGADASRRRMLTPMAVDSIGLGDELSWSPDARTIAFVRDDGALIAINVATAHARVLARGVDTTSLLSAPTFSPDGSSLAYTARGGLSRSAPMELFVVRRDGTGARQVTRSQHSESSRNPHWLPDGRLIYERERFPGDERLTDLWLIARNGTGGRPLVKPYATGESANDARWMSGPPLAATPTSAPAVLRPARKVAWKSIAVSLDAGSDRAIWSDRCVLTVWAGQRAELNRFDGDCSEESQDIGDTAVGETHAAWLHIEEHNSVYYALVLTDLRTRKSDVLATPTFDSDGTGIEIGNLVGNGTVFAFNSWEDGGPPKVWLVSAAGGSVACPGGSKKFCVSGGGGRVLAAGGGRIAAAVAGGIALYGPDGRRERVVAFPATATIEARLSRERLVARSKNVLSVVDLATGERRAFPIEAADAGLALLDVEGELVLYRAAGEIRVLDLASGRSRRLELPGTAPPLSARLEPTGLYYLYNAAGERRPGRVAFVPLADFRAGLGA